MKKRKLRRENFGDDAAYQAHLRASEAAKRAWITRRRRGLPTDYDEVLWVEHQEADRDALLRSSAKEA